MKTDLFPDNNNPFIFLENAASGLDDQDSYLFTNPALILETNVFSEVSTILEKIRDYSKKYWVAGYLSYEAIYGLEEKVCENIKMPDTYKGNLAWFGVFEKPYEYNHQTNSWNPPLPPGYKKIPFMKKKAKKTKTPDLSVSFSIDYKTYSEKISKIKEYLASGDTYQVNFTLEADVKTPLSPSSLYSMLRERQETPYCSFINTGKEYILSFTPELFFRVKNSMISVKPMKGTAPRGRWLEEDKKIRAELKADPKNRSENLMIVDLLRNDLGSICEFGSVEVSRLFEVETHSTLHQMTSTIRGKLRPESDIKKIFKQIFPCGSVTGAPKIRTMQIIQSLEKEARGVYCGAIGYISPSGNMTFSVPIRTLSRKNKEKNWEYHTGGGIVWDSTTKSEWEECKCKCRFLTDAPYPDFEIIESILWKKDFLYLRDHINRMKKTARFFNYPVDKKNLKKTIEEIRNELKNRIDFKIRILLDKKGELKWDTSPLGGGALSNQQILLSKTAIDENNIFLYHKTTNRKWYDEAMKKVRTGECFDVIFYNSKGEITEGGRSNIFIKKEGILITPPVKCGLLPGTLRQNLLRRGKCREEIIKVEDLKKAEEILCGNSVRGLVRVSFNE
jgi:para-aminobenzoate synthetase / 4-amino-4-deoxychorismate lyase